MTKEQRACRGRRSIVCSLKCGKYSQYRWETKRYNGDDNARSSTHTDQCTRKYESNLKKHRKPTDSSNGRSNIDDQSKKDKNSTVNHAKAGKYVSEYHAIKQHTL